MFYSTMFGVQLAPDSFENKFRSNSIRVIVRESFYIYKNLLRINYIFSYLLLYVSIYSQAILIFGFVNFSSRAYYFNFLSQKYLACYDGLNVYYINNSLVLD